VKNGGVPKQTHIEKAAQSQLRPPEPAMDRPAGAWKILRPPAPPHFHDSNSIAFLDQPVRRHTAAETGANYDKVEIEFIPLPSAASCGRSGVVAFSLP